MAVKLYSNVEVMEVGDVDFADGYALYDARYVLKSGDTMFGDYTLTGALAIQGSANAVQLEVKGHSSQSANLQEWQSSGGTVLMKIKSDGGIDHGDSSDYVRINKNNADVLKVNAGFTDTLANFTGTRYAFTNAGILNAFQANVTAIPVAPATMVWFAGYDATVQNSGNSLIDYLFGAHFAVNNQSGNATNAYGLYAEVHVNGTSAVTNAYGIYIDPITKASGATLTNAYGLLIGDMTAGTNKYAIYTGRGDVRLMSNVADKLGFHGATPVAQQTVTGSRGGNAALASLLTKLANLGLVVDSTT